ncbi:MAG: hypothetical protein JSR47_05945 [Proteobacteria bacterium]|nr:hypothetical protein [Pseudomonadota bacterium]
MPRLDTDPLDLALKIKRGFEKTVTSGDRPARVDGGYVLGVAIWWVVAFAALSIVGMAWMPAALLATVLCGFWPILAWPR